MSMRRLSILVPVVLLAVAAVVFLPNGARSQGGQVVATEPPHVIVSLYRVAPGKHLDFLKWMAANEAIDKKAGVPSPQIYVHTNGDAWDYMVVAPELTEAQQAKQEAAAKAWGYKTGFGAGLELRTYMAWHTDTFANGPTSATELVAQAEPTQESKIAQTSGWADWANVPYRYRAELTNKSSYELRVVGRVVVDPPERSWYPEPVFPMYRIPPGETIKWGIVAGDAACGTAIWECRSQFTITSGEEDTIYVTFAGSRDIGGGACSTFPNGARVKCTVDEHRDARGPLTTFNVTNN
jgi:hypothetical protein